MSLKAPTGLISDTVIKLPAEAVEKSSGFALDIGTTVGKLIFRSNKEYKDGKPLKTLDNPSKGQVHYAMFPRDDCEGMIKYIQDNADLTKNEDGVIVVNTSGVGGQVFKKDLEAGLNCKIDIIAEFDCFIGSILAMEKTHTKDELFIPNSSKIIEAGKKHEEAMEEHYKQMETMSNLKLREKTGKEVEEDRPRILFMCGSGSVSLQINKDGSFIALDLIGTAGHFLYGLAAFLTGENDFGKLVEMAERADGRTVGTWMSDLLPKMRVGEEENLYNKEIPVDILMFPFGKGVTQGLDDVKKEDLVHNVFDVTARNHAASILTSCKLTGATEVFMCGNVFNSAIMRDMTLKHLLMLQSFIPMKQNVEVNFVKNGGCMGAMGAFLHVKKE